MGKKPPSFEVRLDNKPNLMKAMQENPDKAKEVIGTFVDLMEEAISKKWAYLPEQFHKDLTFRQLVFGILRGSLDLADINPDAYAALQVEIHPLSFLSSRKNLLDDTMRYAKWRKHFNMPENMPVNEEAISAIFRRLLRYGKYVNIEQLQKALESNQVATHRGVGHEQIALLPFIPALRYQREHFGELHVGKFFDEIGSFDCGIMKLSDDENICPACGHDSVQTVGDFLICLDCNSGFRR